MNKKTTYAIKLKADAHVYLPYTQEYISRSEMFGAVTDFYAEGYSDSVVLKITKNNVYVNKKDIETIEKIKEN